MKQVDEDTIFEVGNLMHDAGQLLAYGASVSGLRPLLREDGGVYPQFIRSAQGYRLVDTAGQTLVDWLSGYGSVLFGYGDPQIIEAARDQLGFGPTLSMAHPLEVEVAGLLSQMVPCAEMVGFGKNGSDAVTAAVRLARTVTDREIVLVGGYHGFHDWYAASNPWIEGIPKTLRRTIHKFPYNDLGALSKLLHRYQNRVAAVVMEPTRNHRPADGYLKGVRELTSRHGALLVFDEVVTSFRLANGGAQELYGVTPDIACVSKSLAHGFPLSAVVGPRRIMRRYAEIGVDMTFRSETVALGVARCVLRRLQQEPVADRLASTGEKLRTIFDELCSSAGIAGRLTGHPALLHVSFEEHEGCTAEELTARFLDEALKNGVVTNGAFIPTCAHDEEALSLTRHALEKTLVTLAERIAGAGGRETGASQTPWVQGYIEHVEEAPDGLHVVGWLLCENGPPLSVEVATRSGTSAEARALLRPDLCETFPHAPGALFGGYEAILPLEAFDGPGDRGFTLCGRRDGETLFRCVVLCRQNASKVSGLFQTKQGGFVVVGEGEESV